MKRKWLEDLIYFKLYLNEDIEDEEVEEEEEEVDEPKKKKKIVVNKTKKAEKTITMTQAQLDELINSLKATEVQEEEEEELPKDSKVDEKLVAILQKKLNKTNEVLAKMNRESQEREERDKMFLYVKKLSKEKPYLADNLEEIVDNGATSIEEIEKIVTVLEPLAKAEWEREQEEEKVKEKITKATKATQEHEMTTKEEKEDIDKIKNFKALPEEEKKEILDEKWDKEAKILFGLE